MNKSIKNSQVNEPEREPLTRGSYEDAEDDFDPFESVWQNLGLQ